MKYYLIAVERSGDLHGSNLIKALAQHDDSAQFRVWGGDYMKAAGADLVVHYRNIALMGLLEVLKNLRILTNYLKQCKSDILNYRPDVVILIDFAGFNLKIAAYAKTKGIRVFYYISPKVWAWNTSRAWKMKKYVDRMFVILPFEKAFYKKFDWDVDYVGNPVADAVAGYRIDENFRRQYENYDIPLVAVLPGSRRQEVAKMLPVMLEVIARFPDYQFLIAGVSSLPAEVYKNIYPDNATVHIDKTYEILSVAKAAIVTSGTATLETALWNVPQVVGYKTSRLTYAIGLRLVRIKYFSLVNLIADENVVTELLQDKCNVETLSREIRFLTEDEGRRSRVFEGYQKVRKILGNETASDKTARLMIAYLNESAQLS